MFEFIFLWYNINIDDSIKIYFGGYKIMIKENVANLLNEQINKEFFSAYLYMEIANYYVEQGLNGFANWYQIQAQEERDHALLFVKYMQNNGLKITLKAIDSPTTQFANNKEPLALGLSHEQFVTESIHTIYDSAYTNKDFRTMQFLDWFVKEQGEEETNAEDLIKKMELFGSDSKGLYLLDNELSTRVYAAPSLVL